MKFSFRHITLVVVVGLLAGGQASLRAQSDIKGDVYVLDPSKAFKAQLVATSGMTGDVVITMPSLSGTMLLTGTAGAQGGVDRSTYLFNAQYGTGTGNALGAVLTSTTPTTNASASGLDILATADGTGTATALKLRATGSTADNYALEIAAGGIKISATLPTAVSSSQPLVLEGGVVKIGSVGTLTGSGTTNTIPVWTSGSALGNSMLSQNGAGTVFTVGGSTTITATTNQLVLGSTNTTTISATAPAASLTYTMPDVGADAAFVMTEGAQTVNGVKTFGSAPNLSALTARGLLSLDASKNVVSTVLTDGQILIGSTGADAAAATLTAGSGITITNGAGAITIAATNPMPTGTTNNATLRYNSGTSAWVENTSVLATAAGLITAVRATLEGTSNQLVLGVTNTTTITSPAPAAARTYTIPDAGTNTEFVMAAGNQSIGGTKTFSSVVNLSSQSANAVLTTDGSKNVASTTLTNGQLLIGSTGAAPVAAALTAGSGITITNGAGSISIAATNPMPAGTTNNATLRYNSGTSTWVENTSVLATSAGAMSAATLALSATSNQMVLGTTNTATISASAPGASRTYTIADPGANASFVMTEGTQTINGVKTFGSAPNLSSLTASGVLGLDASKNITSTALGSGQILIGSAGSTPVAATLTAGSGITVTNGAGSITIAATNPMPTGTTNNATLRYNSGTSAWVENTSVLATSAGAVSATTLALSATSNQMVLGTTNTATISASAPSASRTYTIADPGANASFVMTEGTQTINGNKTISGTTNLSALTASLPLKLDASKNITAAGINLASATEVLNTLPVNRGGTNSATALNSNRIMVSSGGAIVETAALTNGQLLIGSTGAAPVAATLTAGSGITITNGGGTISIASSGWSLTGNAGLTDNTNNYLGTTDAQPIYFITGTGGPNKRMTIGATGLIGMNTTPLASYTLAIQGNVKMVDATTSTISANKELVLEQTGDVYGASRLRLQHRNGSNGALFETATGSVDLVDFGFKPGAGVQSNIRLEARTSSLINSAANTTGEFQFLMASTTTPVYALTLGQGSATFNAGVVGIGDPTPDDKFTVGTTSQFRVSSTGDITRIRDIAYTWPAAHATGVLTNNGSGTLSWTPGTVVPSGTATDQTLRWNGTAWVANSTVTTSATGVITSTATTNQLVLGTTNTTTITSPAPAASRVYTIPDAGAAASFVMTAGAQTIGGAKTFSTAPILSSLTASLPLKLDASNAITAAGINLASATEVLNTLPINRGGTNSTTTLNNNRIMVSSGGSIVEAAAMTNGQILIGSTGVAPAIGTITAGTGISVTNGAGSITIAATTALPTGSVTNSTLTYNGSNWIENPGVRTTTGGVITSIATSNQLVLGASPLTTTINAAVPGAARTFTIPDVGANASFVMTEGAQTINGNKTISGTTNLSALTASLPLKLDASKNITAAGIDLSSATEVLNTLPVNRGGTSFSTYATGDILYASAANTLSKLPIGSNGQFLTIASGVPAWASGSIMQYDVSSAQTSSTTASNFLFNVQYGTITGAATGARIASVTTASNSSATGLAITATGTGTSTATALTLAATGSSTKYALTVADGSGFSGFGTTAPTHVVHAVNSATTDEVAAVLGNASGSTSNQAIGVWGDASNNASANTGSIGVLATGSGRTTTAETNAALQIADGEIRVGRTTETGTGYTVVEGATAGTAYTAEGPSGVIEINLGTVGGWADNDNISNDRFKITSITLNNRYITTSSIILLQVVDKVDVVVSNTVNTNHAVFVLEADGRAAGSCSVIISAQLRNGATSNGNPFSDGDKIKIGYMIVNPSK
jgi:hypothetical protein